MDKIYYPKGARAGLQIPVELYNEIKDLKDKLRRRNMQIKDLKEKIGAYKFLLSKSRPDAYFSDEIEKAKKIIA